MTGEGSSCAFNRRGVGEGAGLEPRLATSFRRHENPPEPCGPGLSRVRYSVSAVLKAGRLRALPAHPRIEESLPAS